METRGVGNGREMAAADYGFYFRLCPAFHFCKGNHNKYPPRNARFGTAMHVGIEEGVAS